MKTTSLILHTFTTVLPSHALMVGHRYVIAAQPRCFLVILRAADSMASKKCFSDMNVYMVLLL